MPGQERTRQEGTGQEGTAGQEPRAILEERSEMIRLTGQWGVDVAWPLSQDSGVEGLCVERGRGEESGERGRPRRGAREAWHEGLPRPGTSGPLRGTEEVPAHARPAPPRLQAGASPRGVSPTEAPTLPPSPPRKGRPAGRLAERRGQERGEGALGPPQPGSWPPRPRPLQGKKIIIRRRRRSEFPGCSHSETQAGKLADAWPAPRETRRSPARLFRKVRAPPAGRAGRVPGPRRRAPPRRSSLSGRDPVSTPAAARRAPEPFRPKLVWSSYLKPPFVMN